MSKVYRVKATLSYFCIADNEEDALEQFEDFCDDIHIGTGIFDTVDFDTREMIENE